MFYILTINIFEIFLYFSTSVLRNIGGVYSD